MNFKVRLKDKSSNEVTYPNMDLMFESILDKPILNYDIELKSSFIDLNQTSIYENDILINELFNKKYKVIFDEDRNYFKLKYLGDDFDIFNNCLLSQLIVDSNRLKKNGLI